MHAVCGHTPTLEKDGSGSKTESGDISSPTAHTTVKISHSTIVSHSAHDLNDAKSKEKHDSKHKGKDKAKDKTKDKGKDKDISKLVAASLVTTAFLGQGEKLASPIIGRERSASSASQQSVKSSDASINSGHSTASQTSHHHHSLRLPSLFRRKRSSSVSSSTLQIPPSSAQHQQKNQHTILMAPKHDIHIIWPHPVPSGNAYIAGTWSVPGHGPWEKMLMTPIPGTDKFEIHLDVQEIEDISDYVDEDGYLHHELLEHHHPHDHTFQDHQALSSSPSVPEAPLSKRMRIKRFFGRSRSPSNASTTDKPKDPHIDLPFHHQSKDGVIIPLTREYRYQFKFVIDNEWKCDPDRQQVQDSEGNWNHELAVDLIEQIQQSPTPNRSRSSSIQSHNSVSQAADDLPSSTIPTTAPIKEEEEKVNSETESESPQTQALQIPQISLPEETTPENAPLVADQGTRISTISAPLSPGKAKDVYEAVMIFDETDDLSDGEGRSRRNNGDDSHGEAHESDDDDLNDNEGDTPQQKHAAPLDVGQEVHNDPLLVATATTAVAVTTVAAAAAIAAATAELTDPVTSSETVPGQGSDVEEDIINSSSVAEPIPDIGEHPVITPSEHASADPITEAKDDTLPEPFALQEAAELGTEAKDDATPEPLVLQEAVEPSTEAKDDATPEPLVLQEAVEPSTEAKDDITAEPSVPQETTEPNTEAKDDITAEPSAPQETTEPSAEAKSDTAEPFILQEAADPDARASTLARSAEEEPVQRTKAPRIPLEVVTDAPAPTSYSQVPSPPLTPSSTTDDKEDSSEERNVKSSGGYPSFIASTPLTPRIESPSQKLTPHTKLQGEKHDGSTASSAALQSSPRARSITSSSSTTTPPKEQQATGTQENERKKELPEEFPNLLWSFCKTTAVVSAAVVVLGLGLGRNKN
ncbi:hypothetical protein BGZ80_004925 [Entomortierella chlamydospora]|uniref:AMP-activated protein kinase glycogen-binding domain-containing protein n=1 Tax=Entomortierella chlamydospora TaxID=101097 RepID=A0A9P6SVL2_9FUNG|nr:hypothetical protein BGZ79_011068 [Entomortierella chlamydospora]KAG0007222.1 hypothetical protein BGZ80_004925 [Entomortierella chlamydospora]